jgi:hypothetical protein
LAWVYYFLYFLNFSSFSLQGFVPRSSFLSKTHYWSLHPFTGLPKPLWDLYLSPM